MNSNSIWGILLQRFCGLWILALHTQAYTQNIHLKHLKVVRASRKAHLWFGRQTKWRVPIRAGVTLLVQQTLGRTGKAKLSYSLGWRSENRRRDTDYHARKAASWWGGADGIKRVGSSKQKAGIRDGPFLSHGVFLLVRKKEWCHQAWLLSCLEWSNYLSSELPLISSPTPVSPHNADIHATGRPVSSHQGKGCSRLSLLFLNPWGNLAWPSRMLSFPQPFSILASHPSALIICIYLWTCLISLDFAFVVSIEQPGKHVRKIPSTQVLFIKVPHRRGLGWINKGSLLKYQLDDNQLES